MQARCSIKRCLSGERHPHDMRHQKGWLLPLCKICFSFALTVWFTTLSSIMTIKGIVCRYGLPHHILTNNGSQFTSGDFKDCCIELGVKICFASVSYPQNNGIVLQGIKTRVYDRLMAYDTRWVEELPSILWAIRTTPTSSNKETLFFLVYGYEAMLPSELRHHST
jgi:hypothetical protein